MVNSNCAWCNSVRDLIVICEFNRHWNCCQRLDLLDLNFLFLNNHCSLQKIQKKYVKFRVRIIKHFWNKKIICVLSLKYYIHTDRQFPSYRNVYRKLGKIVISITAIKRDEKLIELVTEYKWGISIMIFKSDFLDRIIKNPCPYQGMR